MGRTITIPTPPTDDETKLVRILLTNQDVIEMSVKEAATAGFLTYTTDARGFVDEIVTLEGEQGFPPMQFTCTCPLRVRTSFNDTLT